ncbi:hypothetical protein SYNPS1DRAFT_27797 [Syncephalis pseudoplumigaleata]|uniref:Uncharacterized protein n=1 Tax=Syncephalis pseudoplumigaleata TaxID=1712513 RepID=A0A4P9Z3D6_9FUNG|nr:hypothetical protein SYNPS1DRAFT_27797 [Syncephalis pseudoplumigaleata]|eukprot:RKP26512.1 hypothetical protein SYNPS1DRAFT_27797 [Syncephalis pseudoplumigaleata]
MSLRSASGEPPAVLPRWFYATDAPRPHSGQAQVVPQSKATGATTSTSNTNSADTNTAAKPSPEPSPPSPTAAGLFSPSTTTAAAAAAAAVAVAANVAESSAQAAAAAAASAAAPSPVAGKQPRPTNWEPFTDEDSRELEAAYQQSTAARADARIEDRSPLVAVQEDQLFEVDIRARLLRPVYWRGNAYEVRRALWFQLVGNKYEPCEENLMRQLEDGYLKHRPWLQEAVDTAAHGTIRRATTAPVQGSPSSMPGTPLMPASATAPPSGSPDMSGHRTTASSANAGTVLSRWPLLGPYMGQSVIFASARGAWLLSGKFAETIVARFTKGENLGGIKLVRGWDEVERMTQKNDKLRRDKISRAPSSASVEQLDDASSSADMMAAMDEQTTIDGQCGRPATSTRQDRKIEHLVLVVHG